MTMTIETMVLIANARSFQRELVIAKLEAELLPPDLESGDVEWRKGWNERTRSLVEFLRRDSLQVTTGDRFDTSDEPGGK